MIFLKVMVLETSLEELGFSGSEKTDADRNTWIMHFAFLKKFATFK